jgi:hypothetical protein
MTDDYEDDGQQRKGYSLTLAQNHSGVLIYITRQIFISDRCEHFSLRAETPPQKT